MRCVLVDDEAFALKVLESHIAKISHLEIVASHTNVMDAFHTLQTESIDLLFLDIQMPNLTGFEFLRTLKYPPQVIITTAYREYALESYDFSVLDYLVKPIAFERLLAAINKLSKQGTKRPNTSGEKSLETTNSEFFYIQSGRQFKKIPLEAIQYIESIRNQIKVVLEGEEIMTTMALTDMEERLPNDQFIRIHRSYVVALKKVNQFNHSFLSVNGKQLPIGNYYKKQVLSQLNDFVW